MNDDEHGRDGLITALEALPEVEKVNDEHGDVLLLVHVERYLDDFVPPVVLGTIAAHGWGVMSVPMRVVHARPNAGRGAGTIWERGEEDRR